MSVIVLGDGMLGSELCRINGWAYISRAKDGFDITDINTYSKLLPCTGCTIVNCVANTSTYSDDRDSMWSVNISGVRRLVEFCNKWGCRLVHVSSDYVYTGSDRDASEDSVPVHNKSWYGYSKLVSDAIVQEYSNKYLLIRCTHKKSPFPHESAWVDQVGNFDYVDKIADLCSKLIDSGATGLFNVGTDKKSMFDLALRTAIVSQSQRPSHVPEDVSMNTQKLKTFISGTC